MKNLLLIALVLLSTSLFSQRVVGKVSQMKVFEAGSEYWIEYSDNKYFQIDVKKEIKLNEEEFFGLYENIIQGFSDAPGEEIVIETQKDLIRLKYIKSMGVVNLRIFQHVSKSEDVIGVSKYLTKKAVIKLFGQKR
jgi:hypothetical protein